jgi:hypothetical protein
MIELSTTPQNLRSAKTGVHGSGIITVGSPSNLVDGTGHFQTQGVVAGDTISIWKGYAAPAVCTITAVPSQTQVNWASCTGTMPASPAKYYIKRKQGGGPAGECLIDQYYGGDAYRRNGGACLSISFWHFYGPLTLGAASVQVDIPNITPGAATLNGVAGAIPDAWEGMPTNALWNSASWFPPRLTWAVSVLNLNSASTSAGGLGGPLNWNNQNLWQVDFAANMVSADSHYFYINFAQ